MQLRLILMIAAVLGIAGISALVTHKIENARYVSLQRDYALAQARAIEAVVARQAKTDAINAAATAASAAAQHRIVGVTIRNIQEIYRHDFKTLTLDCVPVGFIRVLVASARGASAADLPLAAGVTDDTCTSLGWPALAAAIAADYGAARGNAEQLDALTAAITAAR